MRDARDVALASDLHPRAGHGDRARRLRRGRASADYASIGASSPVLAAILGFGASALLYLVTEDLLLEAHATSDTLVVTATFFLGFLIPLLLAHL